MQHSVEIDESLERSSRPHLNGRGISSLIRHDFQTRVEVLEEVVPRILMTRDVFMRTECLVDIVESEVGWLGTVVELENNTYLIDEIYIPCQEVSGASTTITEDGLAGILEEITSNPKSDPESIDRLRFWGHSHARMPTSPSGQDEKQMDVFRGNGCPWFIRGIFNKVGRAEFALYRFDLGIKFEDVPWEIYDYIDGDIREELALIVEERVTKKHALRAVVRRRGNRGLTGFFPVDIGHLVEEVFRNPGQPFVYPDTSPEMTTSVEDDGEEGVHEH